MKWIKLEDKFPLENVEVVLLLNKRRSMFLGYYLEDGFFRDSLLGIEMDTIQISHWYPIPKIPKDNE